MRESVFKCDKCGQQVHEERQQGLISFRTADKLDPMELDLCAGCYGEALRPLRQAIDSVCARRQLYPGAFYER